MTRGTVIINTQRCKGCDLCASVCPQHVLLLSNSYNHSGYRTITLREVQAHCTGCAVCALICPEAVFTVYREAAAPRPMARAGALEKEPVNG